MALVQILGNYPAKLRCYSFHSPRMDGPRWATHLKSIAPFRSFSDVREILSSQAITFKITPFLFISQNHLPSELVQQIDEFSNFYSYLAFAENIFQRRENWFTFLRSSKYSADAGFYPTDGFPVTRPWPKKDLNQEILGQKANIFSEEELKDFLGEFYNDAGRIVFLRLDPDHNSTNCGKIARQYLNELVQSQKYPI